MSLPIQHFSDVLCVWAYVSQERTDELERHFGDEVCVDYRFVNVFGHARDRLTESWAERGGLAGYADHAQHVVNRFDHVDLHPDTWRVVAPSSSLAAHTFLAAVRRLTREGTFDGQPGHRTRDASWAVRCAFFKDARDVSLRAVQLQIAEELDLARAPIERALDDGTALAELSTDLIAARDGNIRTSPTLSMNDGRQRLTGNVGYRVIEANVRELLERPRQERASWC
ncbi:MAG: disulfide bond formation protein DsbA [Deltaproteobacteria bacterium]|nr:MAG: disulfide bond formation protein DsbA [Deltaproteobacteria bacterium]